jgi:hypothetical protein
MPSLLHEALVLLFRNRPELAPELLRDALGLALPAYSEVRTESSDLTQIVPAQYLADLVVRLLDGRSVLAIVVEVQVARDDQKRWNLSALRARAGCPAVVLVVAPDAAVARWAAETIALGPGSSVQPWVLGPDAVPVVTDPVRARAAPELAVLSAMAHGRGDAEQAVKIALAATAAVDTVKDADSCMVYSDLIHAALGEAARKALQMLPKGYEFQSDLARESYARGRAEAELAARAADVLDALDARGLAVSDDQRRQVLDCRDPDVLRRWLRLAVTAKSAQELFQ